METPLELIIQDTVAKYLDCYNIFPAAVLYCDSAPNSIPSLSITFFSDRDLNDFLGLIQYLSLCDKSGVIIFNDTTSIIISGLIMSIFFNNMQSWAGLEK